MALSIQNQRRDITAIEPVTYEGEAGLKFEHTLTQAMEQHREEVQRISDRIKDFHKRGDQFRIFHGSTNSTRKSALGRDSSTVVDTSRLDNIVHIDSKTMTALVEPNVAMDALVEATLEHGLIPPVVMEFPGITVGGGYSGTSGESSSFRHGFFDRTLITVEIVIANGEVMICSEAEHADLFHGAAGAVGTFGVVTMVELQLRKAGKYVETCYHPVTSVKGAVEMVGQVSESDSEYDYVDGILYSPTQGVVITGKMIDTPPEGQPVVRFSGAGDPWFYLHVKDRIDNASGPTTEVVPLPEYLFRYDRGGFWVGAAAFNYFPGVPFNNFTRWFLDDFLHTRMLYKALHGSGQADLMIIQDLALPYATAEKFIEFTDERTGIWPLWLCPLKQSPAPSLHPHLVGGHAQGQGKELAPMLNIGLWGLGPPSRQAFVSANRDIEEKLRELGGMKWLYAQTYYSDEDFWRQFDKKWYDKLREMYHATTLPNVYDKVRAEKDAVGPLTWTHWMLGTWPLSGLYGLKKAIDSKDYLLARDAKWKNFVQ